MQKGSKKCLKVFISDRFFMRFLLKFLVISFFHANLKDDENSIKIIKNYIYEVKALKK